MSELVVENLVIDMPFALEECGSRGNLNSIIINILNRKLIWLFGCEVLQHAKSLQRKVLKKHLIIAVRA